MYLLYHSRYINYMFSITNELLNISSLAVRFTGDCVEAYGATGVGPPLHCRG